nr:ORF1ab [Bovine astrovirus]
MYLNKVDETLNAGIYAHRALAVDYHQILNAIHPNRPWDVRRHQGKLTASTVVEGEWVTYELDKGLVIPLDDPTPPNPRVVLVAVLLDERDELKRQNADKDLQFSLLRHEYERVRPAPPRKYTLPWYIIFLLCLLGFSLVLPGAQAHPHIDTFGHLYDDMQRGVASVLAEMGPLFRDSVINQVYGYLPHAWHAVVVVIAIATAFKSERRILSLIWLVLANVSSGTWLYMVIAPYQTLASVVFHTGVVIISYVDMGLAITLALLAPLAMAVGAAFFSDVIYIQNLKASILNFVLFFVCLLAKILRFDTLPLAIFASLIRAYLLVRSTTQAATVEIKDNTGKVLTKEPVQPGVLFRFVQRARNLFPQRIRHSQAPLVRVSPGAVCVIETPEGKGTAFFCANYVITAAHVLGRHTVATLVLGQQRVQTTLARIVPGKDIALMKIPPQFQNAPRLKIAKTKDPTWVCVYTPGEGGSIVQSVVPGNVIEGNVDYAIQTVDGMSGGPVVNPDGHVIAVHQTNTGYTGGGELLLHEDVIDPPKDDEKQKLKAELEALKKQLGQCMGPKEADVVALVREAMGREMQILRAEIDAALTKFSQVKKGKTKRRRAVLRGAKPGRRQKGPLFTEEEYQRMLDEGLTRDDIKKIVDEIYAKEAAGFPDWEPMDDDYDPNEDWVFDSDTPYGQKTVVIPSFTQYCRREYDPVDVDGMVQQLSAADLEALGPLVKVIINTSRVKNPLGPVMCLSDRYAAYHGLPPISDGLPYKQRSKPKNLQGGGQAPPKANSLGYWKTLALPPRRDVTPQNFPVVCNLPINRPLYEDRGKRDPLLGLLPPCNEELEFGPATWTPQAITKSFEKFEYAEPSQFWKLYPKECAFADFQWRKHYNFLEGSRVIHMCATEKNVKSTPGYPKCELFQTEEEFMDRHGWAPYLEEFKAIDAGERPAVLWYCFLKKEILKKSKIKDGDIRQIVCADAIYARIGCCLEQHQNKLCKENTESSSGQCGWCPFYGGFRDTMRRIEKGRYKIEFDWTRFDGTIPRQLLKHIKDLRWEKMCPEHRERYRGIRDWYVANLLTRHVLLPTGEVTVQRRGNPSGQISTTIDNNMVNYWLQAFEFAYINKGADIYALWDEYDTIVYGDDRLTATPILPPDYVPRVIQMYREVFGMWVKPDKVKVSDTVIGLTFCGFTVGPDYLPYPTQPEKLWASLVDPVSKLPDIDSLCGKLESFRILMHNHPDHPFKEYIDKCLAALEDQRTMPVITDEFLEYLWRGGPKMSSHNAT